MSTVRRVAAEEEIIEERNDYGPTPCRTFMNDSSWAAVQACWILTVLSHIITYQIKSDQHMPFCFSSSKLMYCQLMWVGLHGCWIQTLGDFLSEFREYSQNIDRMIGGSVSLYIHSPSQCISMRLHKIPVKLHTLTPCLHHQACALATNREIYVLLSKWDGIEIHIMS